MLKGSRDALPSRTIRGWAHAGNEPGNAFWTPRCNSSVMRASTSAASPASATWPVVPGFPSTSTFPVRRTCSAAWRAQVARQITASTEAIDPLTPNASGWDSLHAWVGRYGDIHARYGPIFQGLPTTFKDDEGLKTASARLSDQSVSRIRSKLSTSDLPARQLDPLIALLIACLSQDARRRSHPPRRRAGGLSEGACRDRFHRRHAPFTLRPQSLQRTRRQSARVLQRVEFGPDVGAMMMKEEAIRSGADKRAALNALVLERS